MRKRFSALTLVLMAITFAGTAVVAASDVDEDVVFLKSGRTVRGVILEDDRRGIEISTSNGNNFRIPRSRITQVKKRLVAENRSRRKIASDVSPVAETPTATTAVPVGPEEVGALKLGPMLGLNFANASLSPDNSTSNRTGLLFGGFFEAKLSPLFYVEPELMYAQQGFAVVSSALGQTVTVKYDVIKLPIFAKIKFEPGRSDIRLHLMAGPTFAIKVNASTTTSNGAGSTSSDITDASSLEYTLDFGGGIEYWFSPKIAVRGDLRYTLGLNSISNTSPASVKASDTNVLASVMFAL